MYIKTVGSVCSGIEAASLAWKNLNLEFSWFSEIAEFPSKLLKEKYANIPNLGDMTSIPSKILNSEINSPDLICGGTPCQAFSVAGRKNGLKDERGNLTLSFIDIIESNDSIRIKKGLPRSIVFWENVEGVLKDKTNAFGSFISSLAGFDETIDNIKWPNAGIVRGPVRNIAWRVIDAKYFGVPQQRKRLYVLAGGKDFYPENILFEESNGVLPDFPSYELTFRKNNINFEIFREYTDVLYSAYGTKWNGNAAAYNGSLFISQDNRLRRLSPLECERLMGFPDDYTKIDGAKRTNRYQALGNSWAVPVIKWIGEKILNHSDTISEELNSIGLFKYSSYYLIQDNFVYFDNITINSSEVPENPFYSKMFDIVDINPPSQIYISPVGCSGILRRKEERKLKMNHRLELIMANIANEMSAEEIEKQSRRQKRGAFSVKKELEKTKQINLFETIT